MKAVGINPNLRTIPLLWLRPTKEEALFFRDGTIRLGVFNHRYVRRRSTFLIGENATLMLRCIHFFVFGVNQSEFLQLVTQRITTDIEQPGGLGLVSVSLVHGHFHESALNLL